VGQRPGERSRRQIRQIRQIQRIVVSAVVGSDRAEVEVVHGEHPRAAALRAAHRLTRRPLRVVGPPEVAADLTAGSGASVHTIWIGYRFTHRSPSANPGRLEPEPRLEPARRPQARPLPPEPRPPLPCAPLPRVQRTGAYAVVVDSGRLLLTRLAESLTWTLPGGGIEHGETPVEALVREVYEEAGLVLRPGELLDVDSIHFTGQAPDGRLEDYHGIRVVYAGSVPAGSTPQVLEVAGSTEEAAWVSRSRLPELRVTGLARLMLTPHLLGRLTG
jgi:8-oxo-dGTP pyrophosphatase MutT (NUDIX family)